MKKWTDQQLTQVWEKEKSESLTGIELQHPQVK